MPANTYDVTVVDGPQCGVLVEVCAFCERPDCPVKSATGACGWRPVRPWTTPTTMAAEDRSRPRIPGEVG
jgi:hypothetical protein